MNTSRIHILTTFVLVVFLSHTTHAQTTQKVEDISFVKTPTVSTTTNPLEKIVRLNDTITVNITSRNDPTTPIDIFALLYTNDDTPIKRLHIKTVFNEEQGVQKKYSLKINQELMSQVANAARQRWDLSQRVASNPMWRCRHQSKCVGRCPRATR